MQSVNWIGLTVALFSSFLFPRETAKDSQECGEKETGNDTLDSNPGLLQQAFTHAVGALPTKLNSCIINGAEMLQVTW